ncbi:protein IWS1 homolog 1-like [Helianthus annuus]|uniref:protein IWS1 homolog 1-like n=1 Tax=Helianthus annuus TaxID=4232 RepID=UPI0016530A92|nr:protein IWS1 homolog 1-like [Helianthus annuus]
MMVQLVVVEIGTSFLVIKNLRGNSKRSGDAPEVKEMWDTIVGGDSKEEKKGIKKELDDDYFIDDSGVDPVNRHGSNRCGYSSRRAPKAEEGEEDDEIKELFKMGKKKKKTEKTAMEIAIVVEKIMAELEVVAEEDANLNRASKPAINKLIKLPFLIEALSKWLAKCIVRTRNNFNRSSWITEF